jgi:hypothetical protein
VNLRLAAPAILIASLLLLPFLGKPFTIDDPLYLREAAHVLVDPAHPADFEQVWNSGERRNLSQFQLGGTLPAYLLTPVAALGTREWIAHLYQWCYLVVLLIACAAVARRMDCGPRGATMVALLVACNPITLGMSATCMPDVMAAALGMFGIDRVLNFAERRRTIDGLLGGVLLAAAALCRASALPLVAVSLLLLWPVVRKESGRILWPIAVALVLVAAGSLLGRGAVSSGTVAGSFRLLTSTRNIPRNALSFFAYQALVGPLVLYWILTRGWRAAAGAGALIAVGLALAQSQSPNLHEHAVPGALAICTLIACGDLFRTLPHRLPFIVWLGSGLVVLPYVFLAPKYLLPGIPAAALIIVLDASRRRQPRFPLTASILLAAGWIAGALIVAGDTTLANAQRAAAERIVHGAKQRGATIWAGGQWAFLEYAQRAGGQALANTAPLPRPGDFVVISRLSYYGNFDKSPLRRELLYTIPDRRCGIFVLNRALHAGFFSNRLGYLPFALGCAELDRFDVFRIE